LREDRGDGMNGCQPLQRRDSEFRRAGESQP
jgi:hypothetical protein